MPRCPINPLQCSLALYQQPLWALNSAAMGQGYSEVLLRLRSHDGSIYTPVGLLDLAASVKRLYYVDRIIISLLLDYLQQNPNDQRRFGVNLSADTIEQNGKFFMFLVKELKARNIDPRRLVFEINEHATATSRDSVIQWIRYLETLGACFALDDFGVGHANFLTIESLIAKINCSAEDCKNFVKIDGTFVKEIGKPGNQVIVKALADLCHIYNALTVGEGVETEYQLKKLQELGVDFAQGYMDFAAGRINFRPQLLYEPSTPVYIKLEESGKDA